MNQNRIAAIVTLCLILISLPAGLSADRELSLFPSDELSSLSKETLKDTENVDADLFYPKLLSFEQDITEAILVYEYCNPSNSSQVLTNVLRSIYTDYFGDSISGFKSSFKVNSSITRNVSTYGDIVVYYNDTYLDRDRENQTIQRQYTKTGINGTEELESEIFIPVSRSRIAPYDCIKIQHTVEGNPRYLTFPIDIIPSTNASAANLSSSDLTRINKSEYPQRRWIWWDETWLNRLQVNITNSYADSLVNYETMLLVEKEIGMQDDYDDVRFATDGGTLYPMWMEDYNNTHARFWINGTWASGVNSIWMYYDNDAATSISNPYNIFILFDHFELPSNSYNNTLWNSTIYPVFLVPTVNDSVITINEPLPHTTDEAIISNLDFGLNVSIDMRTRVWDYDNTSTSPHVLCHFGFVDRYFGSSNQALEIAYQQAGGGKGRQITYTYDGVASRIGTMLTPEDGGYLVASNYSVMSIKRESPTVANFYINYELNTTEINNLPSKNLTVFNRCQKFGERYTDWMRVRQSVPVEPSVVYGNPENEPPTPVEPRTALESIQYAVFVAIFLLLLMALATAMFVLPASGDFLGSGLVLTIIPLILAVCLWVAAMVLGLV